MNDALGSAIGDSLLTMYGVHENEDKKKENLAKLQQAADLARMRGEVQQMVAHLQAGSRERVASTNADARAYAADAGYAGRTYAADTSADARGYAADQGLAGRKYAADQGVSGRRYAADRGVEGARTRAGATVSAARIGAQSRDAASRRNAATSRDRGLTSLYGSLFRQRPTNPLEDAPPAPPSLDDFLKQGQQAFSAGDIAYDEGGDDSDAADSGDDDPADSNADEPPAATPAGPSVPPSLSTVLKPTPPHGAPAASAAAPAAAAPAKPNIGDVKTFPNGRKGRWDGQGWLAIQ